MVKHIVFWKLAPEAESQGKWENARIIKKELEALRKEIKALKDEIKRLNEENFWLTTKGDK